MHVQIAVVPDALPEHPVAADAQTSLTPVGITVHPLAQLSVCTALETQRWRERRSAVHVQIDEVPDALDEHPVPHTSSTPTALSTHPLVHRSVCTALETQR